MKSVVTLARTWDGSDYKPIYQIPAPTTREGINEIKEAVHRWIWKKAKGSRAIVDEFMDWRVLNWDMPDSVVCMIRAENHDTGHIKEFVYQRESDARKRLLKLKEENNITITVATHDEVILMTPTWL